MPLNSSSLFSRPRKYSADLPNTAYLPLENRGFSISERKILKHCFWNDFKSVFLKVVISAVKFFKLKRNILYAYNRKVILQDYMQNIPLGFCLPLLIYNFSLPLAHLHHLGQFFLFPVTVFPSTTLLIPRDTGLKKKKKGYNSLSSTIAVAIAMVGIT